MGEVKLFSATVRGRIEPTLVYQGRSDEFWISLEEVAGFTTHPNHYVERLVELEPHPKSEGVCIEKQWVEDFREFVLTHPLKKFGYSYDFVNLYHYLLAQLSDTKATEEQVSLGEVAKVGIELTEEEARTFIEWMGWDTETHNSIKARIQAQLDKLSPPVELPEPKVGERVVAFLGGNDEQDCDEFIRFTDAPDIDRQYVSTTKPEFAKWSDFIAPERVIGGEK